MPTQDDHERMVCELLGSDEGMSDWEIKFVEDMDALGEPDRDREPMGFTPKQAAKIEQIWDRVFG